MQRIQSGALILLLLFSMNTAVFSLYGTWLVHQHRYAVHQAKEDPADFVVFAQKELATARWINAYEFELGGRRYDVIRQTSTRSGKSTIAVSDEREEAMNALLKKSNEDTDKKNIPGIKKNYDDYPLALLKLPIRFFLKKNAIISLVVSFIPEAVRFIPEQPPRFV
jgi:hypothetical protein